jgi:hypothetical protein
LSLGLVAPITVVAALSGGLGAKGTVFDEEVNMLLLLILDAYSDIYILYYYFFSK